MAKIATTCLTFLTAVLVLVGFYTVGGWAQHELDNLPDNVRCDPRK